MNKVIDNYIEYNKSQIFQSLLTYYKAALDSTLALSLMNSTIKTILYLEYRFPRYQNHRFLDAVLPQLSVFNIGNLIKLQPPLQVVV